MLDKLSQSFQQLGLPADGNDIVRDVVQYAIEVFRENWEQLHEAPDGGRVYDFFGDDVPRVLFYGALLSTNIYDFAIVEDVVEIFDADVIVLGASSDESE